MDLEDLTKRIVDFRDARDWKQFHNGKDLAISLVLEANELLEHFQWKTEDDIKSFSVEKKGKIREELADVLYWILLMGHDLEIDVSAALREKMEVNEAKYPVVKAKGKNLKYTEL